MCTNMVWSSDDVKFQMSASASNPLNEYAPPVDYLLNLHVKKDGIVEIQGTHEGSPCFEFYKQVNLVRLNKCIYMISENLVIHLKL